MKRSLAFAALLALAAVGSAQTKTALLVSAAGNVDQSETLFGYSAAFGSDGGFQTLTSSKQWSGMDSFGNEQTMTFSGTMTGEQTFLKSKTTVDAKLENVFYNPGNNPYYTGSGDADDAGVPDTVLAAASTRTTDRLAFGGGAFTGYKSVYRFHIEGTASGTNVGATLTTTIANNREFIDLDLSSGRIDQFWSTKAYPISASFDQFAEIDFTARFRAYTQEEIEGSTLSGQVLFGATVTLDAVLLYDTNDVLVSNYTVMGSGGAIYPVPEPTSLAALGLGALALLRRRSKG